MIQTDLLLSLPDRTMNETILLILYSRKTCYKRWKIILVEERDLGGTLVQRYRFDYRTFKLSHIDMIHLYVKHSVSHIRNHFIRNGDTQFLRRQQAIVLNNKTATKKVLEGNEISKCKILYEYT